MSAFLALNQNQNHLFREKVGSITDVIIYHEKISLLAAGESTPFSTGVISTLIGSVCPVVMKKHTSTFSPSSSTKSESFSNETSGSAIAVEK